MERFARIIELPESQCLLVVEYDEDENAFKVNATVSIGGNRATVGLGYEDEETALNVMHEFDEEKARVVFNMVKDFYVEA